MPLADHPSPPGATAWPLRAGPPAKGSCAQDVISITDRPWRSIPGSLVGQHRAVPEMMPPLNPTTAVVSVVVPMRNEAGRISQCLRAFEGQTWPADRLQVIVVDGGSTDGSREEVDDLARTRPWLEVIDNPSGHASAAFNRGIAAARGECICLFSAHGQASPDFLEQSIATLAASGAAGVGGRLEHTGANPTEVAIGLAMTSPFGMASPFRYAERIEDTDTIGHPVYRLAAVESVGLFDESLGRNSDYVYNWRLRQAGLRLVFDPAIVSTYRPRNDLGNLAAQFYEYGRWKAMVARRYPSSLRVRHLVPPLFAAALAGSPALLSLRSTRRITLMGAAAYLSLVVWSAGRARRSAGQASLRVLLASFPVMHVSWGLGFLWSLVSPPRPPDASSEAAKG